MLDGVFSRYTRSGLKKALIAGVSSGILFNVALAQVDGADPEVKFRNDFIGYALALSPRVSFTDNINLNPDGARDSEVIVSNQISGGAIASTRRITALAIGDIDFSYLADANDFVVNQNVGATATIEGVENWLYLDASAQSSRQLIGDNARISGNINAARNQRASVNTFSVSPHISHKGANDTEASLRYRFSKVFVDDDNSAFGAIANNFLNDSTTQEVAGTFSSGTLLNRVRFSVGVYGAETVEEGSGVFPEFEFRQGAINGTAEYALTPKFSLSGAIGYDEVDTRRAADQFFDDEELSGFFWRAGFISRPNRRTSVRAEYGKRFDGDFIDADVQYSATERLSFSAGASRVFQSRAQNVDACFQSAQVSAFTYAEALRAGGEQSPRNIIQAANSYVRDIQGTSAQTVGVGVVNTAFGAVSYSRRRTNFSLSGSYDDSDFGFRTITAYGINANVNRRVSRRTNAYANVSFRHTNTEVDQATCIANPEIFGIETLVLGIFNPADACAALSLDGGGTDTLIGRVGASYQMYKNVAAFGEYSHSERFSPSSALEYSDNVITAGITLSF